MTFRYEPGAKQPDPNSLGEVFNRIDAEVCDLHSTWAVLCQLFDNTPGRVELWNRVGGVVAVVVHDCMVNEVLLHLSRLTDRSDDSLTLGHLIDVLPAQVDAAFRDELRTRLAAIEVATEAIRRHRNKRIAHRDLKHALGQQLLPKVTENDVEEVLKLIRDFMDQINGKYLNTEVGYDSIIMTGSGEQVIACLGAGLRFYELQTGLRCSKVTEAEALKEIRGY